MRVNTRGKSLKNKPLLSWDSSFRRLNVKPQNFSFFDKLAKNMKVYLFTLTLLHSERPKFAYNFGLSECNRVKLYVICHISGASLKIIQLLQHFEHLVNPLAGVVHVCVEEYGHKSIVAELMRYVAFRTKNCMIFI